ncbi:hypothetical protein ISCGN_027650 [Ixodes scapularis]
MIWSRLHAANAYQDTLMFVPSTSSSFHFWEKPETGVLPDDKEEKRREQCEDGVRRQHPFVSAAGGPRRSKTTHYGSAARRFSAGRTSGTTTTLGASRRMGCASHNVYNTPGASNFRHTSREPFRDGVAGTTLLTAMSATSRHPTRRPT